MPEPTDPAVEREPRAPASTGQVLGGAWLGAPFVVAVLGALVGAAQDCAGGGIGTLVLFAGAGAGLAGWWAWGYSAPARLIALSVLGGGLAGGAAGTFTWFWVSFQLCFTF